MKRKDFQLIGLEDDFLSLMDDSGETRDDLKCPEDAVGEEIKNAIEKEIDIMVSSVVSFCRATLIVKLDSKSLCAFFLAAKVAIL